jgi:L-lactate dehydrogenase complex protein LldG
MTTSARNDILTRLRQAQHGLPRPATPAAPVDRPVPPADFATFAAALSRLGLPFDLASDPEAARTLLTTVMARHDVKTAVLWDAHPDLAAVDAAGLLEASGVTLRDPAGPDERPCPALSDVDMGLTGVDHALCATGTLVLAARPEQPRAVPLVPRLHVALVARSRLLPDLSALVGSLDGQALPSALTCVSGISSTGDIEFMYVKGVHGPLAVHVIGLDWR